MEVRYRVLGPLEVVSDGVVHTPARRLRTLLAALLVEPRTPLSSESLIEAIWSGQRTADAAPTLRRHIARARTELGVPIAATPLGYRLLVEDDDIDGLRLAKAVRDARRDARHEGLRAALRLWRSTPYPELVDWAPGRLASAALAEARIEGLELLVRADLDRAAPSAPLLGELRSIVDEHPYREVFWVLLVLALYRSGRQQEALDAVQAARARLAEDLGVLPGPELVAVERALLDHAPDLRLPQADSPLLPPRLRLRPARAPLVGRTVPLQTLLDAWERVSTHGGGEVVLISGEGGIGKTRLASELAIVVTEGGGRVAYGQCEQHAVAPFEPLAGVLRDVLRTGGPPPPAPVRATLASMLPELATTPAEHRAAPSTSLLADAVATWLIAVASVRPMVLVVDDLHWLTPTGADLLRALTARVAAGSPILLLALARDEALPLPDSMSSPHATRIALAPLDAAQTAQLGSHLGLDPARSLPEVMRSTGGVPLLLELLSEIGEEPATAVTRRVRELGQDAVTVLQVAALEPATFQLDIVADAAELDRAAALRTLDRAVTARVIDELGIGLYRFRHAIVQDVVRDSTSATRRANLHLRLADATRVRTPHALDRLAHHLDLAGPQAAAAAITALVAAGSASAERGAAREALGFADRADRRLEASPQRAAFQTARLDSAIVRATALAQLGSPDWSRVALDAARVADHLGDVDRLVQAVLVTQRVLNTAGLRRTDPGRIELLQKALSRLEPANDPRHAMVITALADALRDSGEHLRMEELRRRVASIGDDDALPPRQRAQLLMRVSGVFDGQGGIPARLAAAAALTQLHNANPSDVAIRQMTAFTNVLVTATTADGSGLHFWLDVLALGIGEPEAPLAAWSVPLCRSWWALANGELGAARTFASDARDAGRWLGLPDADAIHAAQTFAIDHERGPHQHARDAWTRARREARLGRGSAAYDVMLLAEEDPSAARSMLDASLAERFADADNAPERLTALYAYVLAATTLEHRAAAVVLRQLLEPACGSMISTGISLNPSVDHACALCALVSSSWELAATHLDNATELHRRLGARRFIAATALLRGELELRRPGGSSIAALALANEVAQFAAGRRLKRLLDGAIALEARASAAAAAPGRVSTNLTPGTP